MVLHSPVSFVIFTKKKSIKIVLEPIDEYNKILLFIFGTMTKQESEDLFFKDNSINSIINGT